MAKTVTQPVSRLIRRTGFRVGRKQPVDLVDNDMKAKMNYERMLFLHDCLAAKRGYM